MSENELISDGVVISNQPVADFSHLTGPEQLAAISRIEGVALVIVPESLAGAYAAIPSSGVAATIYVPDGANVRVHTGALVVGGDGIGAADDVLIITGMLIITSAVTGPVPRRIHVVGTVLAPRGSEAGYRYVIIAGQLAAPEASRDAIEPRIQVQGQAAWYRGDNPRVFHDDTSLGPDFFRLLDHPASLVVLGDLTIAEGVTEAMLREKVAGASPPVTPRLDPSWWRNYTADFTARMVASTRPVRRAA